MDAVPHRTIPFTRGLSRMPTINTDLVPELSALLPPPSLMTRTYSVLKKRVMEARIEHWSQRFPPLAYYYHSPAIHPPPFMGLNKFTAGQIHQMRARKSYLAAHPSWRAPEA